MSSIDQLAQMACLTFRAAASLAAMPKCGEILSIHFLKPTLRILKLTTKIVKSTHLWSKINLGKNRRFYGKSKINNFQCSTHLVEILSYHVRI
jgi:hypothetical protein